MILQILAWCGAFFIGFVVKGQMNHDFALRIEVNPCVIEITIGNAKAYNTYAHTTAAVAEIGTMVCGGWLKANAPRIEAYNNVQNYTYADGAAKHVGERSYYHSTLLKKEIIKYGTMTNEGGGVYTFRAAGTAFSNVRQTFQSGIWELTTIDGKRLIGHFLLRS